MYMKKYIFCFASAALCVASGYVTAQDKSKQHGSTCYPEGKNAAILIREDSLRTGNNHHCYEYTDLSDTKAPKSYKAFYISHYGRHGSRSDYKEEGWTKLEKQLRPSYEQGLLTPKGSAAYEKALEMCRKSDGMREMLTRQGVREHQAIARRMYKRFPEVFRKNKKVDAKSSTVQRCVLSMGAFTSALAAQDSELEFDMLTGKRYMDYISNTAGYKDAIKGSTELLSEYRKSIPRDTVSFFSIMFKDPSKGREMISDAYHFESNLIECANYCQCLGVEDVFHRCMPFEVYYQAWSLKNRKLYLEHCNSAEFGDKRVPMARSLVNDIISRADAAVEGKGNAADLRFGHDYPLMALCGYLGLSGPGSRYSFSEIDDKWFGSWYICMASNLQLVFYKNKKGHVLVKCLWNEKETLVDGINPVYAPYYDWQSLREHWLSRFPADKYPDIIPSDNSTAPGL